jgi:hypothetical protein
MLSREIVHGRGSDGKLFTLIDCYDGHTRGSLFGVPRPLKIRANALIAGFHSNVADPVLSSVSVSLRHLRDWWGKSGIVTEPSAAFPYFSARFEASEPALLYSGETFRVAVRQSAQAVTAIFEASIRDTTSIDIEAATPQPLSEFQRIVAVCQDFLSIACASFCDVDELFLLPPKGDDGTRLLGSYYARPRHRDERRLSSVRSCRLFGPDENRAKLQERFSAWLSKDRELFDARMLYREGVYGRGVVEHRLLALTQGVEAFHRRFHSGEYMDQAQFETSVRAPLTAAIPASLEASHRAAIASRLKFANEYSQSKRFTDLFTKYSSILDLLVPSSIELAKPIVEVRNEFTHFPVPQRSSDRDKGRKHALRVIRYNWVLRLLLESCFMQPMGFSIGEIRSCVSESGTYRQMAEWLRTASRL